MTEKKVEKKGEKKGKGGKDEKTKEEKINEIITEGATTVKMEVDYSATCDEKLPLAESLAQAGKLQEALDMLMALEKQTRCVTTATTNAISTTISTTTTPTITIATTTMPTTTTTTTPRTGADTHSTGRVLVAVVRLCKEAKDWAGLNERVIDIVKKRSQLKQVRGFFLKFYLLNVSVLTSSTGRGQDGGHLLHLPRRDSR